MQCCFNSCSRSLQYIMWDKNHQFYIVVLPNTSNRILVNNMSYRLKSISANCEIPNRSPSKSIDASWLIGFLCQVIILGQNPGPGCLWPHAGVLLSYFLDICNSWVNVIATMMTLWQLSITRPSVWCTARMSRLRESGVSDLKFSHHHEKVSSSVISYYSQSAKSP